MRVLASRVWVLVLIALLAACAARKHAGSSGGANASAASAGGESGKPGSVGAERGPRGMTWEEYYVDVEQRAKRAGGFVMWFNPPRPVRRPQAAGVDPTVNGPLSSPAR